ncbi:hypothetical protein N7528_007944 [Penicillium herquei]|nr:hypothetical protein N7528_007944 [Penicillium herquei]
MDAYVFHLDDIEWEGPLCQEVFRQTTHLAVTDGFLKRHKALAKLLRCREEEEAKRTAELLEPYLFDSDADETIEEMQESKKKSEKAKEYYQKNPRPSRAGDYARLPQEAKDVRNAKHREDWANRPDDKKEEEADKDRERRKRREERVGLDNINATRRGKRAARTDEEKEEDSRKDKERRNRIGKEAFNTKRRAR